MNLKDSDRIKLVAAHEAGHAVAALDIGSEVSSIKIEIFGGGARIRGTTSVERFHSLDMSRQFRIIEAGCIAENIAREAIGAPLTYPTGSDATMLRADDFTAQFDRKAYEHARQTARSISEFLIEKHFGLVNAIANLTIHGEPMDDLDHTPPRSLYYVHGSQLLDLLAAHRSDVWSWSLQQLGERHFSRLLAAHEAKKGGGR